MKRNYLWVYSIASNPESEMTVFADVNIEDKNNLNHSLKNGLSCGMKLKVVRIFQVGLSLKNFREVFR